MNGGHVQARLQGRPARMIYNQSLSLQSKSSILLFATACPTFPNRLARGASAPRGLTLPGGGAADVARPTTRKDEGKGLEATMTPTTALIGERSYRSGRSPMRAVRMSRLGCDLHEKRVLVSSSRQISGRLGVLGALRLKDARPNIYKTWRRFGLATKAAAGHDEGKISRYPGKLEK